jgi:hypothetical protein
MVPYTITPNGVSLVIDNRMRTIPRSGLNFDKVIDALKTKAPLDLLRSLVDVPSFIAKATFGRVQIGGDQVRFDGEPVKTVIADRLLALIEQGLDVEPLARFMDRLMDNPLETARDELYLFLESGELPITPDGCFLAFKKVRGDYKDIYTGTMDNSVGQVVSMDRASVDPNRHETCSAGLHFCSYNYLSHYGARDGGNRIVIVKVDPSDVVAIPSDYQNTKGRAWRYEVVGEVPADEAARFFNDRPLVSTYVATTVGVDEDGDPLPDGAEEQAQQDPTEATSVPQEGDGDLVFTDKAGKTYPWEDILALVEEHGQRGAARLTGVPRTTIQVWLKSIADHGLSLSDVPSGQ